MYSSDDAAPAITVIAVAHRADISAGNADADRYRDHFNLVRVTETTAQPA